MLYLFLKHSHSILRWVVLILLVYSILVAARKLWTNSRYTGLDKTFNKLTVNFTHLQFLIGLILYFVSDKIIFSVESMKNPFLRFFLIEHILGMFFAVAIITIGYSQSQKVISDKLKNKRIFIYYLIALGLIFISIPWPWGIYGAQWY